MNIQLGVIAQIWLVFADLVPSPLVMYDGLVLQLLLSVIVGITSD